MITVSCLIGMTDITHRLAGNNHLICLQLLVSSSERVKLVNETHAVVGWPYLQIVESVHMLKCYLGVATAYFIREVIFA